MVQKSLSGSLIDVLSSMIGERSGEQLYPLMFFVGLLITVVFLLAGCAHLQPVLILEEPPLRSSQNSNRLQQADIAGQQNASVELTLQGLNYLNEGQPNEAISLFEKAIALHPSNPYAYYYLAKARYIREEYQQAFPLLGKAELYLQDDSTWLSWVYVLRGKTFEALSRFDEARKQYQQSLSIEQRNAEAQEGIDRLANITY